MKLKTDLYTKIVLTAIAVFLGVIVVKDINFVGKANANPVSDIPSISISQVENTEETTLFIFDNARIDHPIGKYSSNSGRIGNSDIPQYIITSKKGAIRVN